MLSYSSSNKIRSSFTLNKSCFCSVTQTNNLLPGTAAFIKFKNLYILFQDFPENRYVKSVALVSTWYVKAKTKSVEYSSLDILIIPASGSTGCILITVSYLYGIPSIPITQFIPTGNSSGTILNVLSLHSF